MSVPNINGEVIGGQYKDYAPSHYIDGRYPPNSAKPIEYVPINYDYEPTSLPPYEDKSAEDKQIGGNHYKDMPIQPSAFIDANGLGWSYVVVRVMLSSISVAIK
jgi:hypothetical protein